MAGAQLLVLQHFKMGHLKEQDSKAWVGTSFTTTPSSKECLSIAGQRASPVLLQIRRTSTIKLINGTHSKQNMD